MWFWVFVSYFCIDSVVSLPLWLDNTTSKEEYASQLRLQFIHFLLMSIESSCALALFGRVQGHSFTFSFWNLEFGHEKLFLSEKSLRFLPFLFGRLCKQNFFFFFAYLSIYIFIGDLKVIFGNVWLRDESLLYNVVISVSSLALMGLQQENIIVQGLPLNVALIILGWFFLMLLSDFKAGELRTIQFVFLLFLFIFLEIGTNYISKCPYTCN